MNHWKPSPLAAGRSTARAFTLIELTVALFLAVFLMVGVAEIFKISTVTASKVEAISDSYQMARGALSLITQDLSQVAPDGYFYILPQHMTVPLPDAFNSVAVPSGGKPPRGTIADYRFDTLFFTAVGRFRQMGEIVTTPATSPGAQIFYGPGLRKVSSSIADFRSGLETIPPDSDQRGVLLIRKAFLLSGMPRATSNAIVPQVKAVPAVSHNVFAQMAAEAVHSNITFHRIQPIFGTASVNRDAYQPVDITGSAAGFEPNVDFLVADRVSEFFVEVWAFDGTNMSWVRPRSTRSPAVQDLHYIWTLGKRNEQLRGQTNVPDQPGLPGLVRVTMVLHPHSDQAPLRPFDNYHNKFIGDVFRRVVRLPGPIAR